MTMQEAVGTSIDAAISAGTVDADAHAAALQALRQLAVRADTCDPEKDNVTYPTMLKYLTALGMVPIPKPDDGKAPKPKSTLAQAREKSRYGKLKAV